MLDITQQKGLAIELHCLQDMTAFGYQCLTPIGDSCRYDVAVDLGDRIIRIQCKSAHWSLDTKEPNVAFQFNAARQTTNTKKTIRYKYDSNEIDYFYTWFEGQGYLIPIGKVTGTTFRMRYEYPSSGQREGIHIAKNYTVEKELMRLA